MQRQNKPSTIRMPKSHVEELNAMRHGPELHDALRKTQSSASKTSAMAGTGNRLSSVDVQKSSRQTQSAHMPCDDSRGSYIVNNTTAVNAVQSVREPVTTEQQQPHGLGMMKQQGVISDSGYWSPKNYNNSDYHVPTTKPADLQRGMSTTVGARPMVPPPAPPPSATDSMQSTTERDRPMQDTGHPTVRQSSHMHTASPGRPANRDSLPPPPPAPSALEPEQSAVGNYYIQSDSLPEGARSSLAPNAYYELPPPPMPLPLDDLPPEPPSPVFPAVPDSSVSYLPQVDMAESPLPLPPEDVNFNMMVVPPPPPPLVESEQITAPFDGEVGNGATDNLDRLQADSASVSSEASSHAAKTVAEDTGEAPVRDHRSDLLVAIRKGLCTVLYGQSGMINDDDYVSKDINNSE